MGPATAVLVLTTFDDDSSILAALQAGASGYLTKEADRETILQAVRTAAQGQTVLSPEVQRRLLALASRTASQPDSAAFGLAYLAVYYLTASGTDPKIPVMGDLGNWNFAVGFGVMLLGLVMAVRWR